ncbi:CRISPR system precrRNA processing endoribonuclease RAMP protein Cas6 [Paucidesulfovibrio longus]|uniref:CRISPR system precrRNA processing endoribonuclease RAMP protein Cas6 n=1 Tax=Paucidesulfovibrio longus TaxID=889 RepID=UPI0003B34BF6|nr:CRISPR system precrRNA processing endoribonuclease RAMP protein Cas6 [Paucidesulfovibrio longus]
MRFGSYFITINFDEDVLLPSYLGSTLRGAFGAALKTSMCGNLNRECESCRIAERCLYAKTFEPKSFTGKMNVRGVEPPPSYVVAPPDSHTTFLGKGETLAFTLLLFGEANYYLPFFLNAVEMMGRRGIGRRPDGPGGALFSLYSVEQDQGHNLFDPADGRLVGEPAVQYIRLEPPPAGNPGILTVKLLTPLRLKFQGHLQDTLPFHVLVRAALRRVSSVFAAHGDGAPEIKYAQLVAEASAVKTISSDLRWLDWERYSNRQKRRMLLGGMVGTISFAEVAAAYLPILAIASLLHIGKQSTFGLGKFSLAWRPDQERGAMTMSSTASPAKDESICSPQLSSK